MEESPVSFLPLRLRHNSVGLQPFARAAKDSQSMTLESSRRLLGVTKDIEEAGRLLIEYTDMNRADARLSGIETIAIEIGSILEGGKLRQVRDALEEALEKSETPSISTEAFSKMCRAERLVADAELNLARFTGARPFGLSGMYARENHSVSGISWAEIPASILLLSIIGAGAILTLSDIVATKGK
jgi:hypothetical protein